MKAKQKKKSKKVFLIPGDEIEFVLTQAATFEPGNMFVGTVDNILHKKFSVQIVPSGLAREKLAKMTDKDGKITVGFRCCRIKDMVAHKSLIIRGGLEILQKKFASGDGSNRKKRVKLPRKAIVPVYNPEKAKKEAKQFLAEKVAAK